MIETLIYAGIGAVVGAPVGFGIGAWWYRRTLKKDPAKLDRFAKELSAEKIQAQVKNLSEQALSEIFEVIRKARND